MMLFIQSIFPRLQVQFSPPFNHAASGNYTSLLPYLQYIQSLGVTTIRFLTLDAHTCEGEAVKE